MTKKLPNSVVSARCGVCFKSLFWNAEIKQFECSDCQVRVKCSETGEFLTEFLSELQVQCNQNPIESSSVEKHLRINEKNKKFYAVYTTFHHPCALPKCHQSLHYFPTTTIYTEEAV